MFIAEKQADLDDDVDGNDFLLIQQTDSSLIAQWQTEYGSRVIRSLAAAQAVPEPASFALAMLSLGLFLEQRARS